MNLNISLDTEEQNGFSVHCKKVWS